MVFIMMHGGVLFQNPNLIYRLMELQVHRHSNMQIMLRTSITEIVLLMENGLWVIQHMAE